MNRWKFFLAFIAVLLIFSGGGVGPGPLPVADGEAFLYRAVYAVAPNHLPLNQKNIGTCVAVSNVGAVDTCSAIRVVTGKDKHWKAASADSAYGGMRNEGKGRISGSYADGSNGYAAVKWLQDVGGVLFKQPYPEFKVDLSEYVVNRCKEWGASGNGGKEDWPADRRNGVLGPLDEEAKKHPIKAGRVATTQELEVALDNGFPVTTCSGIGFNSPRDKNGFCVPRGSWSHSMFFIGRRQNPPGFLVQNSWGDYIEGDDGDPTKPSHNQYLDQPDGSFYVTPEVAQRMLGAGDSWAITDVEGFKPNVLPFWMTNAEAKAPTDFKPEPDPISTPVDEVQKARNAKVFKGLDGRWHFNENGNEYKFMNGKWYRCNALGCRQVSSIETEFVTAA